MLVKGGSETSHQVQLTPNPMDDITQHVVSLESTSKLDQHRPHNPFSRNTVFCIKSAEAYWGLLDGEAPGITFSGNNGGDFTEF